ncbi:MAG: hypothetical protein KIT09_21930 [Bryobacteraceae bacterium]|nr:hypothetical protein [Bryobacteraceae bacterium]
MIRTTIALLLIASPALARLPAQAPGGGPVRLELQQGRRAKVTTNYWRMEFDLTRGGALDTIVFPHGSGRNLLREPFRTYVDGWSDADAPRVSVESSEDQGVARLVFSGTLASSDRSPGAIAYRTTWTLSPFAIRADHLLSFPRGLKVSTVGIASTSVRGDLDEYGLRAGPAEDRDPRRRSLVRLGKLKRGEEQFISERHAPVHLLFFRRGVEGFDLTTASDLATWTTGLTGKSGMGRFDARLSADGAAIQIVREPLHSPQAATVAEGTYAFSYYLGLPRIVEKSDRKWRHLSFGNHPWPSDEEVREWAGAGVNLVRLHNDYSEDGDFWRDGAWPPYDAKGMAEMRRVIAACRRHKIRVVPYFSIYEFHPEANGYREREQEWKRTTDEAGTVIHNTVGKGEYGAQMCPQSGWLERRKRDIEQAYRELGFDGIYYDWTRCLACNNRHHKAELHLATDEVVDLLAWTRRLIAPDGVLILHMPGNTPSITLENFADLVVNMEELSSSDQMLTLAAIPLPTIYAESLPRSPCPSYRADRALERNRNNIAHLVAMGMFPWSGAGYHYLRGEQGLLYRETLKLFRAFKPYRLEDYRLRDALSGAVAAGAENVLGAVYVSPEMALVILSNAGAETRRDVAWRVTPEQLGFGSAAFTVRDTVSGERQTVRLPQLTDGSLKASLGAYEYRLFEIRPAK